ncbi:discoidin domain-containing protein [Streptacidiphilus neutrinimicus]|uniref:discoidin domain-containing protein n=1 Tax=Streptacidiphilus neutrinimicus TaxID=105420 RepID=UPI0005A9B6FD|nr:discoidin domain-containing protein [Streptacidiphilus neutrinimicus]
MRSVVIDPGGYGRRSRRRPLSALLAVVALLLAALSAQAGVASRAAAASCGTTDLAQNRPATASSLENSSFPASNAVDGNTGTRWSSGFSDPQWLQVDLGSTQTICQVVLNWETASGKAYQIQTSNDATNWTTIYSTASGPGGTETLNVSGSGRYIRMYGTQRNTQWGYSLWEFSVYGSGGGTPPPPTGGSLGSNVVVFDPTMSQTTIQNQLNSIANAQGGNEFGTARYAILFKPGTYGSAANPLIFSVGFYESVAGLGLNPGDTVINGTVDVYNQCNGGVQTQCYATTNFWRSLTNLTINVTGMTGCYAGDDFWAVSQAAPLRRVHINGNLSLMDYCTGSPDWASGGFIADSEFTGGTVTNGSQQQFFTRNSSLDGWSNAVWNQVFCGDPGAPAQSFASNSGDSGGPNSYTTLANCPETREAPYLYLDASGNYQVFVPSLQTNSSGPTWLNGSTPGVSLPLSTFFVVQPSATTDQINAALAAGDNLLFTPGVYQVPSTISVTHPDTKIVGLGFPTLVPSNGNTTLNIADVNGVNVTGVIFDAGPVTSPTLLTVGTAGSGVSHAADPVTLDDVFFRIGGATAGSAATALVDNSNNSIVDDAWIWRADHGAGAGTWTGDQSDTGLVVNGNNVVATGLAVEHFQKNETVWNGQGGEVVFFQNENPYEVPNQASWMSSSSQKGYPAFYVAPGVTSFQGYGMGSYSYFDQSQDIHNAMAFQAPNTSGVQFHDLLTVFLNGSGGIDSVINGTGQPVSSTFGGPSDVVSYP